MYRSLNSEPVAMEDLVEFVRNTDKNSIVMGDFNVPGINWQARTAASGREKMFLRACEDAELEQLYEGHILDLLLTNVPERVVEVKEVGRLWEERPDDDSGEHKYEKK
jgi:hypothetical protein